jgi:hypothetical protein
MPNFTQLWNLAYHFGGFQWKEGFPATKESN